MILSISDLDRLISRGSLCLLAGFALVAVASLFGIGAISAVHLIGLGALLASVAEYRRERGLWMYALLFGGINVGTALLAECCMAADIIRGVPAAPWTIAVDLAIALRCQWLIVRAMASVVVYNRRLTISCEYPRVRGDRND
jgi:hypothetical protein